MLARSAFGGAPAARRRSQVRSSGSVLEPRRCQDRGTEVGFNVVGFLGAAIGFRLRVQAKSGLVDGTLQHDATISAPGSGAVFGDDFPEGDLEGIGRETLPRQPRRGLPGTAEPVDQGTRPLRLRPERRDGGSTDLGGDSVLLEVGADRLVAEAAARERFGPRAREPLVVDVPDALERLERVGPRVVPHAGLREAQIDLASRAVAMAQRARRELDRVWLVGLVV